MLRHRGLYNPVIQTDTMEAREFMKYVDIRRAQKGPTSQDIVTKVKDMFYDFHKLYGRDVLDPIWEKVGPALAKNAGLAQFVLDYDGAVSDFFFPWLITIHTSPSLALEMAYGEGFDIKGRWRASDDDEIDYFVRNDPTFVYNRERQLFVADLVTSVRDARPYRTKSKIVDLGAGRMAWGRWHGFEFLPAVQEILAFDIDPTIAPEKLFEPNPAEYGIAYHRVDIAKALGSSECEGASLVILGGVASYYPPEVFESKIVEPVYELLKDGGAFFFDLQLDCPYYRRSVAVFDWPAMQLAKSASAAIDTVEMIRQRLWSNDMKFSAEYALDTYNPEYPISVMVVLTKI